MNVSEIIEELYHNKALQDCINKFIPDGFREDFKQELFLILLEKDSSLIKEIHESGRLMFYVVRIIINLARQKHNVYHVVYVTPRSMSEENIDLPDEVSDLESRALREGLEDQVFEDNQWIEDEFGTFFYRKLLEEIKKHGGMRAVSRATGIPVATVSRSVKKIRESLNKKINEGDPSSVMRRMDLGVRSKDSDTRE